MMDEEAENNKPIKVLSALRPKLTCPNESNGNIEHLFRYIEV